MRILSRQFLIAAFALSSAVGLLAQQPQPTAWAVPRLIRVSSSFIPLNGLARSPLESATLAIYAEEAGGAPLWQETQNVSFDGDGHYSILLGSTRNEGLPVELFATGEPRWVGVQFQRSGEIEQSRLLLASVPYALKAVDADTLGGHPASAYMLAPTATDASGIMPGTAPLAGAVSVAPGKLTPKITSGTTNNIAKFVNATDLGNSVMTEANGKIGIGTSTPAAALEVVTAGGGAQFTNTLANNFTFNTFSSPGNASYLYNFGNAYPTSGRFVPSSTLLDASSVLSLSAGDNLRFYTGGNFERIRIDLIGRVGIGTTTPGAKLDVVGDINLTGRLLKSGNLFLHTGGGDTNAAFGISAFSSNSTGYGNAAGGFQALFSNKDAYGNTGFGAQALYTNVSGIGNTAVGDSALVYSTVGLNTAVGYAALYSNTTGSENTATGVQALNLNLTGAGNTATGFNALRQNVASFNTATGDSALSENTSGADNTAYGWTALQLNNTGSVNTAIGFQALRYNTTCCNTAVGALALTANDKGFNNTASGYQALTGNVSGNYNTADGSYALQSSTGTANTAVGAQALEYNNGNSNTAIGWQALAGGAIGTFSGSSNIALGSQAGGLLTTGSNNIMIGNLGIAQDNNAIRIGTIGTQATFFAAGVYGAMPFGSAVNVIIDGNGQLGTINSSRRFKEDIQDMRGASSDLMRLRPVTYRYKQAYGDGSKPIDYGLIAEEVAEVYPDLVVKNPDGQIQTVQYQKLTPMMLNELQKEHLHARQQDETIRLLQEQNQQMAARLSALEAVLSSKAAATPTPEQ